MEIFSEHGASECADPYAEHCDWGIPVDGDYYGTEGSFQSALAQGYTLGVLAGTDSHDGRPGSIADGPSCVSYWMDQDGDGTSELTCLHHDGGLTAVMAQELSRSALFQGLGDRSTLASSGVMLPLRVAATNEQGALHLPGEHVGAGPLRILASLEGLLDGQELLGMDLVSHQGEILGESTEEVLDLEVELGAGDAVYLRVRLQVDEDEQRMWASPFFG